MRSLFFILSIVIVGSLTGCRTSEQITSSATMATTKDSVVIKEIVRIDTIRIASDSVRIEVPVVQLKHDTVIKYRSRNASVTIEVDQGQLKATANCDSLERLVLSYEKTNTNYRTDETKEFHSDKLKIVRTVPWYFRASFWILIILFILGVAYVIIKTYSKTIIPWN